MIKRTSTILVILTLLSACIVLPVKDERYNARCELSSDKKTLKVFNVAEETNSYYSIEGYMLSPILLPTTFILSAIYMVVNNVYHYQEKKIVCGDGKEQKPN